MLSLIRLCSAMLLSPRPFRVEVSGRAVAQPVRRCITYLLPVKANLRWQNHSRLARRTEADQVVGSEVLEPVRQPAVQSLRVLADEKDIEQLLLNGQILLGLDGDGQAAEEIRPRQTEQPMPGPLFVHAYADLCAICHPGDDSTRTGAGSQSGIPGS